MEFLEELSKIFEIVIFTAATKEYADSILNIIDPDSSFIKYRLYRNHTTINTEDTVKDLNNIGRDLNKVIIIDNIQQNFKCQKNNGLLSKTWRDDVLDTQLYDFRNILMFIHEHKLENVRDIISAINQEINIEEDNSYSKVDLSKLNF